MQLQYKLNFQIMGHMCAYLQWNQQKFYASNTYVTIYVQFSVK